MGLSFYTYEIIWGYKPYTYEGVITWDLVNKYNPTLLNKPILLDDPEDELSEDEKKEMKKDFYKLMPLVINMTLFTHIYKSKSHDTKTKIIQLLYLICSGYILIVSLPIFTISLGKPFSQTRL